MISRRRTLEAGGLLTAAAAAVGGVARAEDAPAKPAAATAADALPAFRFALGEQPPVKYNGGQFREASVVEFPASENIAGVLVELEPGGVRELHWHANAAEWSYMIAGRCRVVVTDPDGHSEVAEFAAGDVWYFPRGHGHVIQAREQGCTFIEVFNNGHFSGFGTFSSTDWLAHTPPEVLAKNFGVPAEVFAAFPKKEVFITKGAVPKPAPEFPPAGSLDSGPLSHRFELLAQAPQEFPGGDLRLVSAREFPLSDNMTGALMRINPGGLRELHWHPNADEWQYFLAGRTRMTVFGAKGRAETVEFGPGDVGYVPQGYGHYLENVGDGDSQILLVLNSGDYQDISVSEWFAANPPDLLAANFGVPESVFADFPKRKLFMVAGKS
ncbi:MAG: cupin domain-containing protein [Geminicoccaceae bacterium]